MAILSSDLGSLLTNRATKKQLKGRPYNRWQVLPSADGRYSRC